MSATQVITFDAPGPTTCGGRQAPTNTTEVNTRRPQRPMSCSKMIKRLEGALLNMENVPCNFWNCRGPGKPEYMVTCQRCWAVRDIRLTLKHLKLCKG